MMKAMPWKLLSAILGFSVFISGMSARAELPAAFDKNEIEANVLRKFVSLQSEKSEFYRITDIQILETVDNTYQQPGYIVQINYETPECKNNYFKGLAYSVACTDDGCPFGMVYRHCFQ